MKQIEGRNEKAPERKVRKRAEAEARQEKYNATALKNRHMKAKSRSGLSRREIRRLNASIVNTSKPKK